MAVNDSYRKMKELVVNRRSPGTAARTAAVKGQSVTDQIRIVIVIDPIVISQKRIVIVIGPTVISWTRTVIVTGPTAKGRTRTVKDLTRTVIDRISVARITTIGRGTIVIRTEDGIDQIATARSVTEAAGAGIKDDFSPSRVEMPLMCCTPCLQFHLKS